MHHPAHRNVVRPNQGSFEESCDKYRDAMHMWNYLQSLWEISKVAKWIWSSQAHVQKTYEVTRNSVCFNGRKTAGYWPCGIKWSTRGHNHCLHILSEFWKLGKKKLHSFSPCPHSYHSLKGLSCYVILYPYSWLHRCNTAELWWLTLARHQVLTKPFYHSPPQQESVGENKWTKKTHGSR